MKLGELIADVYPGLEPGIKEIRKDLKLAVNNPDKFKKSFISEDGKAMSLRRRFMLKGVAIATIALFLILSGSACREVPAYTDPETPTQPTSTATLMSTPTEKPIETQEPTKTSTSPPTETSTPTEEELYSPAAYSFQEAMKKYGYDIAGCEFFGSEFNEVGLVVLGKFGFKEYKVTDKGLFLVVTRNFKNKEYPLEILIDPQISYVVVNSVHFLDNKEAVEKWFKVGRDYYFIAFIMNNDGTLIPGDFRDYNNEEWKEIRSNIDEILTQGGSTPEFYLMLNYAQLILD